MARRDRVAADGNSALHQPFERWREALVAALDRVLGIAEQMGKAELQYVGVPALASKAIARGRSSPTERSRRRRRGWGG